MEDKKEVAMLKWTIGVVYSLLAVLVVFLIINLTPQSAHAKAIEENITVSVPVDVAKTSTVRVEVIPSTFRVDPSMETKKDYITGLRYYNGNVDFNEVYKVASYWCDVYDINLNFLLALMYVESKYENGVVSSANCVGLCQLSQGAVDQFNTARWKAGIHNMYTLSDVKWNWQKNIEVACFYLDWLWEHKASCTNTTRTYIQSYNYGINGVKRAIQKGDFAYADAIIKYRNALDRL